MPDFIGMLVYRNECRMGTPQLPSRFSCVCLIAKSAGVIFQLMRNGLKNMKNLLPEMRKTGKRFLNRIYRRDQILLASCTTAAMSRTRPERIRYRLPLVGGGKALFCQFFYVFRVLQVGRMCTGSLYHFFQCALIVQQRARPQ